MNKLKFVFDGEGEWEAQSRMADDGVAFTYRIQVCDDGTFDTSKSDRELGVIGVGFASLAEAVNCCQVREDEHNDIEPRKIADMEFSRIAAIRDRKFRQCQEHDQRVRDLRARFYPFLELPKDERV